MRRPESFFPPERFGAVKAVVRVSAGLSAAGSYMVSTDAGEFFLRLHAASRGGFEEMVAAQRLAAARGIAPAVVLAEEGAGAIVSVKVEGAPFGFALAQPETRLRALRNLCETLGRLHATPTPDLPLFELSRGKDLWDQQLVRTSFPAWATPLGAVIDAGIEALEKDKRRVFSHNDVNSANLLWDGAQVWIVDWEGAALAHPYLDLATFAAFLNFSDDDAVGLLAIQEGAGNNRRATDYVYFAAQPCEGLVWRSVVQSDSGPCRNRIPVTLGNVHSLRMPCQPRKRRARPEYVFRSRSACSRHSPGGASLKVERLSLPRYDTSALLSDAPFWRKTPAVAPD